jgi:hypothetical protein
VEPLEARNLLSFTNVLVSYPAEDTLPRQDTQSETAVVLGANSNVIVAFNDDGATSFPTPTNPMAPLNPTIGGYSLSTKGGTSFTDEGQLPDSPPYWAAFDPVLARNNLTGTIFLSTTSNDSNIQAEGERVLIYRSTNNGQTFSLPIDGSPGFVEGVDGADKPWIAVDNYPGPGYGNVYLSWTNFNFNPDGSFTNKGIFFTRSTDDGQDWGPSGGVSIKGPKGNQAAVAVQGSFVTVGPDHAVYVFWWDSADGPTIRMRKSTDQGQTFGGEQIVTGLKTHGVAIGGDLGLTYSTTNSSSFRSNAYPQAAVNPVTGDIYVVYDDQPNGSTDKADIFFTMSTDGGNTWSKSIRVNDDNTTTDQWQLALAVTPDGNHVGIFWYDRRNDPVNDSLIDRYGVIGTMSGHTVSFGANFRITDVSFPPAFGQDSFVIPPTYMGDYDMAAADNNYFYTTWGDNRLSDQFFANQPDVRFAKIPVGFEDNVLMTTSTALKAGTFNHSATATGLGGSALMVAPTSSRLSSGELGILDPVSTANTLFGPARADSSSLMESVGPLSDNSQTCDVFKTSEVLPAGSAAGNQKHPASPLVRHSVHAGTEGFVTDFGRDIVSDLIAENIAMTLAR